MDDRRTGEWRQLRKLRLASILETCSLLVLVFIAVPLKHLGGVPAATALVGPLHGLTFLFYMWVVIETVTGGAWTRSEIVRLVLVAFVPLGGFANLRWLDSKMAAARASDHILA
jgi:integral membrane protein